MRNIIFIAAPAAGKGTQCETLVGKYGYNHISTGDLLRAEVQKSNKEISDLLSSGALVSDEVVFELLENKLKTINGPVVLDGFPRTLNQCDMYKNLCQKLNIDMGIVIYLTIDLDLAMKRSLGRLSCSKCGKIYNKYTPSMIPKNGNLCDGCNTKLTSRSDDNEETFTKRFNTYLANVQDILEYYKNLNILNEVSASGTPEEIFEDIENVLKAEND